MEALVVGRRFAETREHFFPLFEEMAEDPEFLLRQTFAEQLSGIVELCKEAGTDDSYRAILDDVLPRLAKLLADSQPEVRIAAGESLVAIAPSIRNEDLGHSVLTIVIQLAHDDEKEDLRMTAAVLLNELAPTLGPELCEQFVLTEICYLAEDPEFRVRKAAALNMDAICRTVGPNKAVDRLLPAFLELTNVRVPQSGPGACRFALPISYHFIGIGGAFFLFAG